MPQNKDQLLRYQVLNACFKETSRYNDNDKADVFMLLDL